MSKALSKALDLIVILRLLLDDAFDAVSAQQVHLLSKESSSSTAYMAMGPSNDENCSKKSRVLPEVDIMEDPGIWIRLDEGCNSNCHGDEWAENAEKKLKKMTQIRENKLAWIHRRERSFNGIGDAKVITYGKRSVPAAWMLQKSRKILPGFLESHEQKGHHPLLLSDESQAKMGFVKDMPEGICYLKDYDDYLEMYRAKGSGLKVVCISHFPRGRITPEMFVNVDPEKVIAAQDEVDQRRQASMDKRSVSPMHPVLAANPATKDKGKDAPPLPPPKKAEAKKQVIVKAGKIRKGGKERRRV